jgi:hypothetical protein
MAAYVVLPRGQNGLAWFVIAALAGMIIMTGLSRWYSVNGHARRPAKRVVIRHPSVTAGQVRAGLSEDWGSGRNRGLGVEIVRGLEALSKTRAEGAIVNRAADLQQ